MARCARCGATPPDPATYCHRCGERLPQGPTASGLSPAACKRRLQGMDSEAFERLVADLWALQGWETTVTQASNDRGVDVVATRSEPFDWKLVFQAKRHGPDRTVGGPKLREYASLREQEDDVDCVVVVTTNGFSAQARDVAARLNVKCIDGDALAALVDRLDAHHVVERHASPLDAQRQAADDAQATLADTPAFGERGDADGGTDPYLRPDRDSESGRAGASSEGADADGAGDGSMPGVDPPTGAVERGTRAVDAVGDAARGDEACGGPGGGDDGRGEDAPVATPERAARLARSAPGALVTPSWLLGTAAGCPFVDDPPLAHLAPEERPVHCCPFVAVVSSKRGRHEPARGGALLATDRRLLVCLGEAGADRVTALDLGDVAVTQAAGAVVVATADRRYRFETGLVGVGGPDATALAAARAALVRYCGR
jgi:hypothetical protein